MKLVDTPRPEANDWKSIVGPWIVAFAPPAHSTWATLSPPRSALWAMDSAFRMPVANAEVLLANVLPLMWNVLLVEPWTPGQAPVARLYQPAPVLGGASVSRPSPVADPPFFRNEAIVGHQALGRVLLDLVLAHAVRREQDGAVGWGSLPRRWLRDGGRRHAGREQAGDGQHEHRPTNRGSDHDVPPCRQGTRGLRGGGRGPVWTCNRTWRNGVGPTITHRQRVVKVACAGLWRRK